MYKSSHETSAHETTSMDPFDSLLGNNDDGTTSPILPLDPSEMVDVGLVDVPLPPHEDTRMLPILGSGQWEGNDAPSPDNGEKDDPGSMLRVALTILDERETAIQKLNEENSKLKARVGDTRMLLKQFAQRKVDLDQARKELNDSLMKCKLLEERLKETKSSENIERNWVKSNENGRKENLAIEVLRTSNKELDERLQAQMNRCSQLKQKLASVRAHDRQVERHEPANVIKHTGDKENERSEGWSESFNPRKRRRSEEHKELIRPLISSQNLLVTIIEAEQCGGNIEELSLDLARCTATNNDPLWGKDRTITGLAECILAASRGSDCDAVSKITRVIALVHKALSPNKLQDVFLTDLLRKLSFNILCNPEEKMLDVFCSLSMAHHLYAPLKVMVIDIVQLLGQKDAKLCASLISQMLKSCPALLDGLLDCKDGDMLGKSVLRYITGIVDEESRKELEEITRGASDGLESGEVLDCKGNLIEAEELFSFTKALRLRACTENPGTIYTGILKTYLWPRLLEKANTPNSFRSVVFAIGEVLAALATSQDKTVRLGTKETQEKLGRLLVISELPPEYRCSVVEALVMSLATKGMAECDLDHVDKMLTAWRSSTLGIQDIRYLSSESRAKINNLLQGKSL